MDSPVVAPGAGATTYYGHTYSYYGHTYSYSTIGHTHHELLGAPLLTMATAYYGWPLLTMATAYYGHYCTTGAFLLQHADETRHLARAGRSGEARVRG